MQVRSAYRKKGWAFTDPQHIEQCAKEGYAQKLLDQAGEGCHFWGALAVNKVGHRLPAFSSQSIYLLELGPILAPAHLQPAVLQVAGNIHFAPGRSFQQGSMHVHDLVPFGTEEFDVSHTVHKLSFGKEYPGMKNPLDGVLVPKMNAHNPMGKTGTYQYFLKVRSFKNLCAEFIHLTEELQRLPAAGGAHDLL